MDSAILLSQGLELMLFGMGTVIVFLFTLIIAIRLMSLLTQIFFSESPEENLESSRGAAKDSRTAAIVSAAVTKFRSGKKSNS